MHIAAFYVMFLAYLKKANPLRGGDAKLRALMERGSRAAERMDHAGTQLTQSNSNGDTQESCAVASS